jgi:hypothetical protein
VRLQYTSPGEPQLADITFISDADVGSSAILRFRPQFRFRDMQAELCQQVIDRLQQYLGRHLGRHLGRQAEQAGLQRQRRVHRLVGTNRQNPTIL